MPEFQSEAEEAKWWETHRLGQKILGAFHDTPLSEAEEGEGEEENREGVVG